MPDTRLTWFNIREHIRKFALIYAAVIAVVMVLGNLLWISTAPRVPDEARVLIYMVERWSDPDPLKDIAEDALEKTRAEDDTIREVTFETLMFTDPEEDYTGLMVLLTRLAVGEGDAFFANQAAMDVLVKNGACLPLDEYYANGWLKGSGLEPYYATITDEETGETTELLAGFKLDELDALAQLGAFDNEGAYLAIAKDGGNIESTMKAVTHVVADLREGVKADA